MAATAAPPLVASPRGACARAPAAMMMMTTTTTAHARPLLRRWPCARPCPCPRAPIRPQKRGDVSAAAAAAKKRGGGGGGKKAGAGGSTSSSSKPKQKKQDDDLDDDDDDDDEGVTLIAGDDDDDDDSNDEFFEGEGDEDDDDDDSWFQEIGEGNDNENGGAFRDDDGDAALADPSKRILTDGARWGPAALDAARRVLSEEPELEADGVSLYAFRVLGGDGAAGAAASGGASGGGARRVDVRLDSAADAYGSPSMAQIEAFARAYGAALEQAIGVDAAAEVAVEVSSPGAERPLALPADLRRFAALPLRVEYFCLEQEEEEEEGGGAKAGVKKGKAAAAAVASSAPTTPAAPAFASAGAAAAGGRKRVRKTAILRILDDGAGPVVVEGEEEERAEAAKASARVGKKKPAPGRRPDGDSVVAAAPAEPDAPAGDGRTTVWRLADVKANAPTKGRGLTRRQRDQRFEIALSDLASCRIHVEF